MQSICRQLKYQDRIRSKFGISLEIILNGYKCLTISLSTQILTSAIAPLSFISGSILCEFTMLPEGYTFLFPQVEEMQSSS